MGTALTIPQLKSQVLTYPRTNAQSRQMFDEQIERWIYELCDWPFWFLSQRPSPTFFSHFPITGNDFTGVTRVFGDWAEIGWIILRPGQSVYIFANPAEDEQSSSPDWWSYSRVNQIDFIKIFNDNGTIKSDLDITSENLFFSRIDTTSQSAPRMAMLQTGETYSKVCFHPAPDRYYAAAVQFSLREAPLYTSITDSITRSRFCNYAASAVYYKVMAHMADFFNESEDLNKYLTFLLGAPAKKGDWKSESATGGIIGKLKQESRAKADQLSDVVAWKKSANQALMRNNWSSGARRWRAYPGGFYPL